MRKLILGLALAVIVSCLPLAGTVNASGMSNTEIQKPKPPPKPKSPKKAPKPKKAPVQKEPKKPKPLKKPKAPPKPPWIK